MSLFLPAQAIRQESVHPYALQTNYRIAGNAVGEKTLTSPKETPSWYFLKGVEVEADATNTTAGAVVALGDSITDGAASEANTNKRWPDVLSGSIQANKALAGIGVLNAGINGNRLLHDGTVMKARYVDLTGMFWLRLELNTSLCWKASTTLDIMFQQHPAIRQ